MKALVLTALMGATIASAPANAAVTYIFNTTAGPITAAGTVTTDGTIGVISDANITNFSLNFSGARGVVTIDSTNGAFGNFGDGFVASARSLTFDYSSNSLFQFYSFRGGTYLCGLGSTSSVCDAEVNNANDITYFREVFSSPRSGVVELASVAGVSAVPEPATWAMMIGGFGGIGGVLRQRRKSVAVTYA